jgi:1-phosphofructokinase family hexose kinase
LLDEKIILDLEKTILDTLPLSKFFVFAGSLPRGCPPDTYCRLIDLVRKRGGTPVLDTRDEALREGLKAKPYLIKPNDREASALLGKKVSTQDEVAQACVDFTKQGITVAIISMGKDGAIMACPDGVFKAVAPQVEVGSTVGAGDSLVAGACMSIARETGFSDALRMGVACGTATATAPGTSLCKKAVVDAFYSKVEIKKIG